MVIIREEMQEIAKAYKEPIELNLDSHSALDVWQSQSCLRLMRERALRSIAIRREKNDN